MKQKIVCRNGKCTEQGTVESEVNVLFDDSNIVDKIEPDLVKRMIKKPKA